VERLRAGELLAVAPDLAAGAETVGDAQVVTREVAGGLGGTDLRRLAAEVRGRLPAARPGVVLLASEVEGIVQFVVAVNEAGQAAGLHAGDIVKAFAPVLGARGGGKADLAQGAGGSREKLDAAFAAARESVVAHPTGTLR
jgi:alanyl-tRNA synthetase